MILFTGDIVNTHAKEMYPWIESFNKIRNHKYGKYSVLGNHDYGEYVTWPSQTAKDENFEDIKAKILFLWNNEAERKRRADKGFLYAENFRDEIIATELMKIYRDVI